MLYFLELKQIAFKKFDHKFSVKVFLSKFTEIILKKFQNY